MPEQTTTLRARKLPALRARATAVVSAGLLGSVALTGVAVAAEGAPADVFVTGTATQLADAAGTQAQLATKTDAQSWVTPIEDGDYTLSATYGNSGDRWASTHSGQDFAVPVGTPVHAVHGGTVVKAGPNGAGDGSAYGNAVVIKHADGVYTQYAHLERIDVKVGQQVTTDDQIALSGNTGNSSGPHLHFEVRTTPDYGSAVDPAAFLRQHDVDL
jgi:murein DD-endopeptidase MepM/ murein hydrolase activator NlpD